MALVRRHEATICCPMRVHRSAHALVRTAMAVLFGLMSLLHGPVMTFAKANSAPTHHAMHSGGHAGNHEHSIRDDESPPIENGTRPVCNPFGCCVSLESVALRSPAVIFNPIGTLSPGLAAEMVAASLKPAVPPPRLQV